MELIAPTDSLSHSADLTTDNIERLRELFPQAVTEDGDGKRIDFDVLHELLGGELATGEEKYGLNWHGKRAARRLALTPSTGTLRPAPEDSVDWDTTQNLMIEGDNLEVLKLLQKSYAGKVKMIYIDPPYNTGKDFVYKDDFRDGIGNYQRITGQRDAEGARLTTNVESSGRFHTDWLNMMYPRLILARQLLRDEGVVFVSCDDNEASHLASLCDLVFGQENRLVTFYVQVRYEGKTLTEKNDYQKLIEQVFVYQKAVFTPTKESENYTIDAFCWQIKELSEGEHMKLGSRDAVLLKPGQYQIQAVEPSLSGLKETWATGTVLKANASGKFFGDYIAPRKDKDGLACLYKVFGIGEDGLGYRYFTGPRQASATKGKFYTGVPLTRVKELEDGNALKFKPISNFWSMADSFGNCRHEGGIEFGAGKKPIDFITKMLDLAVKDENEGIILDFFAGSGSTGHAVFQSNMRDKAARKYILVQLPEPLDPLVAEQKAMVDFLDGLGKPRTIAELTKERLRRMASKDVGQNGLFQVDAGFRVFKLDTTGVQPWDPTLPVTEQRLLSDVDNILPGRTEQDLLYELLLKRGLELTVPIVERTLAGKQVFAVSTGDLIACLAPHIESADVEALAEGIVTWHKELAPPPAVDPNAPLEKPAKVDPPLVVFRDTAFADDVAKSNLTEILKQHSLTDVRSL